LLQAVNQAPVKGGEIMVEALTYLALAVVREAILLILVIIDLATQDRRRVIGQNVCLNFTKAAGRCG